MASLPSWYGNYYRAQRVPSLPRRCVIPDDIELSVDYATVDDQSSCHAFIRDSAKQGRGNVGEDEYEGTFASRLELVLSTGQIFAARDVHSQQVKAFVVVSPSVYARTFDCCLTSLYVFLERQFQTDAVVYQHLMRLAVEFSQDLCLGYTNALINVSSSELELLRLLRRDGFLRVGTLERCVKVAGKGLTDSVLLAKCLTTTARARRSAAETDELLDKFFPEKESLELYSASVLPTADFLPMKYVFSCGITVICRNMRRDSDEDSAVYEIWRAAAAKGQGYGADEAPTLAFFRMAVLLDHYCVVFEEVGTGKIVGLTLITASHYSRTNETRYGESNLFVVEEFRDRKIGSEGSVIELALMKQLGFTRPLNDALASNLQMAAIHRQPHGDSGERGWRQVGVIPDGCFVEGYGWDDQLIMTCRLDNCPEFTQLAEASLKRENSHEPGVLSKL